MTIETITLDWRGLRCPEPILKTARQVRKLRDGQDRRILIFADDDAFPLDIKSWCASSGVKLLGVEQRDGFYEAQLQLEEGDKKESLKPAHQVAQHEDIPLPAPVTSRVRSSAEHAALSAAPKAPAATAELDCVGMCCPEPVLQLARRYRKLEAGESLLVLADDDAFPIDVQSWLKSSGAELVGLEERGNVYRATLRKPGPVVAPSIPEAAAAPRRGMPTPRLPEVSPPQDAQPSQPATPAPAAPQAAAQPAPSSAPTTQLRLDLDGLEWEAAKARLESMSGPHWQGELVEARSINPTLQQSVVAWSTTHGHELVSFEPQRGSVIFRVGEGDHHLTPAATPAMQALVPVDQKKRCTLLVIHNDFESLMAALMIANTSAVQDIDTTIFFSFWGVNLLRGDRPRQNEQQKPLTLIHRMFRWMMPKGPKAQPLSKMNFGGMGKQMMLASMRQQNVMDLETLMAAATENNVRFTVCTMSMSIMGIQKRDIMDMPNIEFAGVASFVADSATSDISMVF